MVCKMYDLYRITFKGLLPVTGGNVFYSLEIRLLHVSFVTAFELILSKTPYRILRSSL